MEKDIKDYIVWYRKKRSDFCREIYIDKSTWLKRKLLPYSNWDDENVLIKESELALEALTRLGRQKISKSSASLAQLTLSNRIEYISDHSDFYVTYAGILTISLTIINISLPAILKVIITLLIFSGVIYSLTKRIELRKEIATSKELINILKQY